LLLELLFKRHGFKTHWIQLLRNNCEHVVHIYWHCA